MVFRGGGGAAVRAVQLIFSQVGYPSLTFVIVVAPLSGGGIGTRYWSIAVHVVHIIIATGSSGYSWRWGVLVNRVLFVDSS